MCVFCQIFLRINSDFFWFGAGDAAVIPGNEANNTIKARPEGPGGGSEERKLKKKLKVNRIVHVRL